ncbi:MAG: T9SS type A sorting domain-containing protein [Bacteroidetes bacterium]|nr:T9SS type A sorting domain-containing protein [Bacteroidota bacterium]
MSNEICLDSVIRVLNKQLEPVNIQVSNTCIESTSNLMEQTESFLIQVYPNPVKDLITITLPKINEAMELNIIDAYGNLVFDQRIKDIDELKIKTSTFSSGIYTVQLKSAKYSGYKRFIKQ